MGEGKRSPLYHPELWKLLCLDELTVRLVATIRWEMIFYLPEFFVQAFLKLVFSYSVDIGQSNF